MAKRILSKTEGNNIKTVLILTIPRSGSSLLAGILHRLGIPMGNPFDLSKGKHLNKYGCYEDQEFQRINLNILFESGLLLDLTKRLDINEDLLERKVQKYNDRIKNFIRSRKKEIWGFKDPALSYIVPYVHQLFENPYYIHLKRDIADTAASLYKTSRFRYWLPELKEKFPLFSWRNRFLLIPTAIFLLFRKFREYKGIDTYYEVVKKGHERIEKFLADKKYIEIHIENLLRNPRHMLNVIIDFLEISPTEDQINEALNFINPDILGNYQAKYKSLEYH
ncbi:MAG: sulfotransferase [Candidatus Marinimicrobia bacterium]|nr:sulfotransferase [Candidatus Neomarinimicrobiota bacterium]